MGARVLHPCGGRGLREGAEAARAAAIEASAAVMAAVAAAKADARKVTTKDLFGMDKVEGSATLANWHEEVKEYRMQGNYGATNFIKP